MESLYPVSEEGTSEGLLGGKAHSTEHRGGLREEDSGTGRQLGLHIQGPDLPQKVLAG